MINISEYGIKIKNIEAATLFEYNLGVRDHYEYTDAMFTNSLFNDFLLENGLEVYNGESTRDIICLEFNYGSRSYRQEVDHLHKIAVNANKEYKDAKLQKDNYLIEVAQNKRDKINRLIEDAYKNKDKYEQHTKEEIRRIIYNNGIDVEYVSRKKNGDIIKRETLHYKMLFRSTGKAKKGTCMFIREELYEAAHNFLYMGLKMPDKNADIVGMSAYIPLIASGIEGRVKINPRNILILKDVDRFFNTKVISIETDENKHCHARRLDDYRLKNTLFDGQALIDSSVFPSWAKGYILLRHHFTKAAAFNTNLQQFFKDWCEENGKDYETETVEDLWGNPHRLRDIEMVTTDNAVKWIKYDVSYDYWCKWVEANGCLFGVVKHSHPSKVAPYQKMSYQMVNSLTDEMMPSVISESVGYISELKKDDEAFKDYLRKNVNFANDYEVLLALCEWNKDFVRTSYYRERKKRIINDYLLHVKSGELLQYADNLTIVGSPYAMLLYSVSGDPDIVDLDDTLLHEDGTIQCYTSMFKDNEYLAGFRSPFNGKYNLSYMHNHYDERFVKYFNFAPQIIAVNMIGTDFQDRNNGSDQDSDFQYVTSHNNIVMHAKYCYENYHTIVNNIPKDANKYDNTLDDFARMDNMLANSQRDIGESSNLAQIAQTYTNNFSDQKYEDYCAILSVLAQAAIDSAKRRFDIDISGEILRIKRDMDIDNNKYPIFWSVIKRGFNKDNINTNLRCPMNYLAGLKVGSVNHGEILDLDKIFISHPLELSRVKSKKIEKLIEDFSLKLLNSKIGNSTNSGMENELLLRSDFDVLVNRIRESCMASSYVGLMSWLLNRALFISTGAKQNRNKMKSKLNKNRSILLKVLYDVNNKAFLECFVKCSETPTENPVLQNVEF